MGGDSDAAVAGAAAAPTRRSSWRGAKLWRCQFTVLHPDFRLNGSRSSLSTVSSPVDVTSRPARSIVRAPAHRDSVQPERAPEKAASA